MLYQDKVLKENWTFKRGELYMIDHKRGQRPRQSTIEVSVDRKSTRLNSSHPTTSRMPSSA